MLTQDEAELYDRQIRLWGVNAQSRLRGSKVLMLGFNGLASEVAKILTLAGIDTLTIVDDAPLQKSDLTSNLFCRDTPKDGQKFRTHQVKEKLRTLNPLVKVNIDNASILSKSPTDFKGYDLVTLHSFLKIDQISSINKICRDSNIKFYLAIDFGFFGFMFSDLGPNFKYTYEEYDKAPESENYANNVSSTKSSGEEKDPINLGDDDENDAEALTDDDHDRDDSDRPKKRRRYHSPGRTPDKKNTQVDEKKHKVDTLPYASFEDMISFKSANFDKKSSPVLFMSIALIRFFDSHDRLPALLIEGDESNEESIKQDLSELNQIMASIKDSLKLDDSIFRKLDPEWSESLKGSVSPICAIMGGIAGQDMIRALSNKDIPIYNTFSFDGIDMSGVVEKVGVQSENKSAAPIVRDYLEID